MRLAWGVVRCLALAIGWMGVALPAGAVNQLVLTVGSVASPLGTLAHVRVTLGINGSAPNLDVRADSFAIHEPGLPVVRRLEIACPRVELGQPQFQCNGGRLSGLAGSSKIAANLSAAYDPVLQIMRGSASQVPLAGGLVQLSAVARGSAWAFSAQASALDLAQLQHLVRPWFALPAGFDATGHVNAEVAATNRPALTAGFAIHSADLNFANAAGTVAGQQLAATLDGTLIRRARSLLLGAALHGSRGQALAGPVFLDLTAHPLALRTVLMRNGAQLEVDKLDLTQHGVIEAHAEGRVTLTPHLDIDTAQVVVDHLVFPGAFTTFLQLKLASNAQAAITSSGEAGGELWLSNNAIIRADGTLRNVSFDDPVSRLFVQHANGDIHWAATSGSTVPASHLDWTRLGAYGLAGGAAKLTFLAWNRNFALLGGNVRLPVLNGAIVIHTLVGRNLGLPQATFDFDADLTPISMPRICRAFHWPIMNGQLSGHIPLVHYRSHELTFDGDLVARVFDGTITGSHIRLQDPLGQWPQLSADVHARGLDLGMVTRTFALGSITGRVDADVTGLQLFDWSPVAFDARLYTMPGDRSAHRISQRAVTRIAGLGGGGNQVAAALESGALRFFHTFHYERLAIGCRLRNQVCRMSGAGPAPGGGYYLVEGSWLPHLDIIGNVHRVDWPRLLSQITQGIENQGISVH